MAIIFPLKMSDDLLLKV